MGFTKKQLSTIFELEKTYGNRLGNVPEGEPLLVELRESVNAPKNAKEIPRDNVEYKAVKELYDYMSQRILGILLDESQTHIKKIIDELDLTCDFVKRGETKQKVIAGLTLKELNEEWQLSEDVYKQVDYIWEDLKEKITNTSIKIPSEHIAEYLKEHTIEETAKHFNKSKVRVYQVSKDKNITPKEPEPPKEKDKRNKSMKGIKQKRWTDKEVGLLKEYYPNHTAKEVGYFLERTEKAVNRKAQSLGLRKYR